jgi:hypothetical protein
MPTGSDGIGLKNISRAAPSDVVRSARLGLRLLRHLEGEPAEGAVRRQRAGDAPADELGQQLVELFGAARRAFVARHLRRLHHEDDRLRSGRRRGVGRRRSPRGRRGLALGVLGRLDADPHGQRVVDGEDRLIVHRLLHGHAHRRRPAGHQHGREAHARLGALVDDLDLGGQAGRVLLVGLARAEDAVLRRAVARVRRRGAFAGHRLDRLVDVRVHRRAFAGILGAGVGGAGRFFFRAAGEREDGQEQTEPERHAPGCTV